MNNIPTIHLVLLIAAVWRLANLLANEDGPFHFIQHLRRRIGRAEARSRRKNGLLSKLHLYEGVQCEYCNSVWFGTLFAVIYLIAPQVATALAFPLALSTGAIIVKHIVFVVKSVDTRFDQQNQSYLNAKATLEKRMNGSYSVAQGASEWDAIIFEQNLQERR